MTSRDIIRRVLDHDSPPRIGFAYSPYGDEPRMSDLGGGGPAADLDHDGSRWIDDRGGECWKDEWGCTWRRLPGKTKGGEVIDAPIKTWDDFETYTPPSLDDPGRYEHLVESFEQQKDRYRLGSLPACSFDTARYLRRLENYLLDCAAEPALVRRLNRMVSDIVLRQISIYSEVGADGVFFCEDWGTQIRLLVSPTMWRDIFRPDFERMISHAHSLGLTVWMHSCGKITDIVPDLVELGMDVLQFDQPDLHGIDTLAEFHDKVTYWCPVDIQTTLLSGSQSIIQEKAREMVRKLGAGGGLIAKDYPDEFSIGADPQWQQWAYEAFVEAGHSS